MAALMVGLRLKLQMETVDENDPVFVRLPSLHIHLKRHILTSVKTHPDIYKGTS